MIAEYLSKRKDKIISDKGGGNDDVMNVKTRKESTVASQVDAFILLCKASRQ